MATREENQKIINARAVTEMPSGLCVRTRNDAAHVEYVVGGTPQYDGDGDKRTLTGYDGGIVVTLKRDAKERWAATFNRLKGTNKSGAAVLTDGYATESPGEFRPTADHAFLSLARQMRTLATLVDSETAAGKQSNAALLADNAAKSAELHAMQIISGIGDGATTPLSDSERGLVNAVLLPLVDSKLAEIAKSA